MSMVAPLKALTQADMQNLEGLRIALRQNPAFGVGTQPGSKNDAVLHASMLRLESAGLVRRASEHGDVGIWWQALPDETPDLLRAHTLSRAACHGSMAFFAFELTFDHATELLCQPRPGSIITLARADRGA